MSDKNILNISGYRFVALSDLSELQTQIKDKFLDIGVMGNIMLATEGINVGIAGTPSQVYDAKEFLETIDSFKGIWLKESWSTSVPYKKLRIRVRNEIIAFDGQQEVPLQLQRSQAPAMTPEQLDEWLDNKHDFTLLDARNDYEIVSGGIPGATHLDIKNFRHFKDAIDKAVFSGKLDPDKPLVTFCTGGIRCAKAAPWLLDNGFREVYQLDGGVLNYLESQQGGHWEGHCFVFDDRVEVDTTLTPTGAGLCDDCQLAVPLGTECRCQLGKH